MRARPRKPSKPVVSASMARMSTCSARSRSARALLLASALPLASKLPPQARPVSRCTLSRPLSMLACSASASTRYGGRSSRDTLMRRRASTARSACRSMGRAAAAGAGAAPRCAGAAKRARSSVPMSACRSMNGRTRSSCASKRASIRWSLMLPSSRPLPVSGVSCACPCSTSCSAGSPGSSTCRRSDSASSAAASVCGSSSSVASAWPLSALLPNWPSRSRCSSGSVMRSKAPLGGCELRLICRRWSPPSVKLPSTALPCSWSPCTSSWGQRSCASSVVLPRLPLTCSASCSSSMRRSSISSRSRVSCSWPLSTCQPRRRPPNCSLASCTSRRLSPKPSSSPYSRRTLAACRLASRPSSSKPVPRSRSPVLSSCSSGDAPGRGGGSSDSPASSSSAAVNAGSLSAACAFICSGDRSPGPKAPRLNCCTLSLPCTPEAASSMSSSTSASSRLSMEKGWPLRGSPPATRSSRSSTLRAPTSSRVKRSVTPRADTLSTWISRRDSSGCRCSDSAALSMVAKFLSGWPRSDRRTRCTATAGCGHNCRRTGPSNTSVRSW